ncbi:MAG: DUF3800 domain-containing protein, partial [Planctomycetota bacterium]
MVDLSQFNIPQLPPVEKRQIYNVYCDESCHLEHDGQAAMVLGAIWRPLEKTREIATEMRSIRLAHGLTHDFEVKWTKVGGKKAAFYEELVKYFFWKDDLRFRALVAGKEHLDHAAHSQTHDQWYYKMYFDMLKIIFRNDCRYRIYPDVKDTHGREKVAKLHEVLCNAHYDFDRQMIERVQTVRSHEVEQLQLADLLVGIISYAKRGLTGNPGKERLVGMLRQYCGASLTEKNSPYAEKKVNIFHWQGGV